MPCTNRPTLRITAWAEDRSPHVKRLHPVDLSKDNLLLGVQAVDKDGNVSPATYPFPAH
jgi:hypothetical protein